MPSAPDTSFRVVDRLDVEGNRRGRRGVLTTPHGTIETPAFVPVGTQATVKALTPEHLREAGAQAVLGNAYHLHLQPGSDVVDAGGGLARFMTWDGPTYTDSGGFQVMSLGAGFKKVIDMTGDRGEDAPKAVRLALVDDDGVTFRSHRDGSTHRFTAEVSLGIQHRLGADIMFAFDELTTLHNTRAEHERGLERTHRWAERALREHDRLTRERAGRPLQSLWGVVQGANYEDLRREATRGLVRLSVESAAAGRRPFGGYGIGGALEKHRLGEIVGWCVDELPDDAPRHLLGISEPEDIFAAVEHGADTFDCVTPTRLARHGYLLTRRGKLRVINAGFRDDHRPLDDTSTAPTAQRYTRAYLHHLYRAKEHLAGTLASIVNVAFVNDLMADVRAAITEGRYVEFRDDFLAAYHSDTAAAR